MSDELRAYVRTAATALHTDTPPPDRCIHIARLMRLRCSGATDAIVYLVEQHTYWTPVELYLLVRRVTQTAWTHKVQRLAHDDVATRLPPDARALLRERLARPPGSV